MKNFTIIFTILIAMTITTTTTAQYSNATLNGAWFLGNINDLNSRDSVNYFRDSVSYFIFDGKGNITEWGAFGSIIGSNYSVTSSGSITGIVYFDHYYSLSFTGQLNSSTTGSLTLDVGDTRSLFKVNNPGALTDSLVGLLDATNVTLCLNSLGQIIWASGLTNPVSGRVYANSGIYIGHLKTGDIHSSWVEFSISGKYSNDSLNGILYMDGGHIGASHLIRKGSITGIFPISTSMPKLNIYPNPASDIITLNIDNKNDDDLTLNIYNVIGSLVQSEILKQNNRQFNIGNLSNGVYMVIVNSKNLTESQKLIIQK